MFETQMLPPLRYVEMRGDIVKIHDLTRRVIVEVHFRRVGVSCPTCDTDKCPHIEYALTVPDVQKAVWKRIKDCWDLPKLNSSILWMV
jgi:hypothetical protein